VIKIINRMTTNQNLYFHKPRMACFFGGEYQVLSELWIEKHPARSFLEIMQ
jgi:hypothetical protein